MLIPVFLDRPAPSDSAASPPVSSLTLPLGRGTLLDLLCSGVRRADDAAPIIVPTFETNGTYERTIQEAASVEVRVARPGGFGEQALDFEDSDWLVIVDVARWPASTADLRHLIHRHQAYRGATHLVAVGRDPERTREQVDLDGEGNVERVRRLYVGRSWPAAVSGGLFLSLVPARAVADVHFSSLTELRLAVLDRGLMCRDLPASVDLLDLTGTQDLLALNGQVIEDAVGHRRPRKTGHGKEGIIFGTDCVVHRTARLEGPVVVQDRVRIEENVVIVGPAVIGRDCRIGPRAMIVQSMLRAGSEVETGATIVQAVVSGACSTASSLAEGAHVPSADESRERMQHCDGFLATPARREWWRQGVYPAIKRTIDVVLGSAALVLLAPLFALVAILIKRDSPGPVFFVHRRETKGGGEFPCLKFRTMAVGAHAKQREMYARSEIDGPQFKINDDYRVTRIGRWLRRTNIDELPQLLNVVAGHMSLVGPRPSPFRENQICVPWRRGRLSVPAGITGLWQLCRDHNAGGDFNQWILFDLMYVRRRSIWLDLKILCITLTSRGGRGRIPTAWLIPLSERVGLNTVTVDSQ